MSNLTEDNKRFKNLEDLPMVLSIPEIANVLGIGRNTAYALIRDGVLYSVRVGRQIRVSKVEMLRYLGVAS